MTNCESREPSKGVQPSARQVKLSCEGERLLSIAMTQEGAPSVDEVFEEALRFYVLSQFEVVLDSGAAVQLSKLLIEPTKENLHDRIDRWITSVLPGTIQTIQ